jgi:hypothetical protein
MNRTFHSKSMIKASKMSSNSTFFLRPKFSSYLSLLQ